MTAKLAKSTDKLPALCGFASLFTRRLGAEYVPGLWSDVLIEGLACQDLGSGKISSEACSGYIGLTWSWANYDGIAVTGVRRNNLKDAAEIK